MLQDCQKPMIIFRLSHMLCGVLLSPRLTCGVGNDEDDLHITPFSVLQRSADNND